MHPSAFSSSLQVGSLPLPPDCYCRLPVLCVRSIARRERSASLAAGRPHREVASSAISLFGPGPPAGSPSAVAGGTGYMNYKQI